MTREQHPYDQPTDYLDIEEHSLAYWRLGSGPDLVFIHGWPVDSRTFRNSVSILAQDHTCHLLDLPGAGLSRWSGIAELRLSSFSRIVAKAVEKMELSGQVVMVGHDSGGGVARLAVKHLGDKVAGYVLGNTEIPFEYTPMFEAIFKLGKTPLMKPLMRLICKLGLTRQLFCLGRAWAGSQLEKEMYQFFVKPLLDYPIKLDAALSLIRLAHASDFDELQEAHTKISGPVRFLWGSADPWFPLEKCHKMIPGFAGEVNLEVVEGAGLMVHEEQPEMFAEEVRTLVAGLKS